MPRAPRGTRGAPRRAVPCRSWFWSIPKNEIYLKWLHGRFGMNQPRGLRHDLDLADFGPDFAQIWPFLTQKVTLGSQKKLQNVFEMALWTIWYEPTARIKTWPRFSRFWPKFCPNLALFGPKSHPEGVKQTWTYFGISLNIIRCEPSARKARLLSV